MPHTRTYKLIHEFITNIADSKLDGFPDPDGKIEGKTGYLKSKKSTDKNEFFLTVYLSKKIKLPTTGGRYANDILSDAYVPVTESGDLEWDAETIKQTLIDNIKIR